MVSQRRPAPGHPRSPQAKILPIADSGTGTGDPLAGRVRAGRASAPSARRCSSASWSPPGRGSHASTAERQHRSRSVDPRRVAGQRDIWSHGHPVAARKPVSNPAGATPFDVWSTRQTGMKSAGSPNLSSPPPRPSLPTASSTTAARPHPFPQVELRRRKGRSRATASLHDAFAPAWSSSRSHTASAKSRDHTVS